MPRGNAQTPNPVGKSGRRHSARAPGTIPRRLRWARMEAHMAQAAAANPPKSRPSAPPEKLTVRLVVNGEPRELALRPWTTLLDALRDHLELTDTKKGCEDGQCVYCTVLVAERRINSSFTLDVLQDGRD